MVHPLSRLVALLGWLVLSVAALTGCTANTARITSADGQTALSPSYTTAVYGYTDENTVHVFLTDMDLEALLPQPADNRTPAPGNTDGTAADLQPSAPLQPSAEDRPGGVLLDVAPPRVGQLTHIFMFIRPSAGRTPIDPTAVNATVQHAVFAGEDFGVYIGGGFVLPKTRADSGVFAADFRGGTLALGNSSRDFQDLLGSSTMNAKIRAVHDERTARKLLQALDGNLR